MEKIEAEAMGITGGSLKQLVIPLARSPGSYGNSEASDLCGLSGGLFVVKELRDDQIVLCGSKWTMHDERHLKNIDKILKQFNINDKLTC